MQAQWLILFQTAATVRYVLATQRTLKILPIYYSWISISFEHSDNSRLFLGERLYIEYNF